MRNRGNLPWKTPHGRLRELARVVRGMPNVSRGAVAFLAVICQDIDLQTGKLSAGDAAIGAVCGSRSRRSPSRYRAELRAAGVITFVPGGAGEVTRYRLSLTDEQIVAGLERLEYLKAEGRQRAETLRLARSRMGGAA
jgi:hypothetical protein